ncbi:hypothetical protein [Paraburkholderia sp. 22B1P]|uniref:hypothetical protein n=1 Tax=Paraburkholderia sp. 22B1P TaxID=3080498 RepID=UPI0030881A8D|nr:hypothetical protein PBP221_86560 [Paraburkholderia sp. 22B1P]
MGLVLLFTFAFFATNVDVFCVLLAADTGKSVSARELIVAYVGSGVVTITASATVALAAGIVSIPVRCAGAVPAALGLLQLWRQMKRKPEADRPMACGLVGFFVTFLSLSFDNFAVFGAIFAQQSESAVFAGATVLLLLYAGTACLATALCQWKESLKLGWSDRIVPVVLIYVGSTILLKS